MLGSGDILAGKYEIVSVVGEGGYGKVYRGYDVGMKRYVAIKELLVDTATTSPKEWQNYQSRFRKEAQVLSQFSHPNVVTAYALETNAEGNTYLVLEYVDGGSLEQLLKKESPLEIGRALDIAIDMPDTVRRKPQPFPSWRLDRIIVHDDIN